MNVKSEDEASIDNLNLRDSYNPNIGQGYGRYKDGKFSNTCFKCSIVGYLACE
jgi:hypothetical protein